MTAKKTASAAVKPERAKTAANAIVTTVSVAAGLILLNVLTCQARARVDLTEQKIYSLSSASKSIVRGIPEKLIIKGYFGNVPAEQQDDQHYVESLLEEYAAASAGRIAYEKIEVDASNKPEAQEAQRKLKEEGIERFMTFTVKDDQRIQSPTYFHVKFSYMGQHEVWQPERQFSVEGLEYEFTMRIKRLAFGKKKIGVTQGFGEPAQTQVMQLPGKEIPQLGVRIGLADVYDVVGVNWASNPQSIEEADVLVVNGPTQKVSEEAKYYLDQHLMRGEPVIFLVRGMKWDVAGNPEQQMMPDAELPFMGTPVDDNLADLMATYGFEVARDVILDPRGGTQGAIFTGQKPLLTTVFFPVAEVLENDDDELLQGMEGIALPFASTVKLVGPLEGKRKADGAMELFKTSGTSFSWTQTLAVTENTKIPSPSRDQLGRRLAAVAVQGSFKSFYADKPKPPGVAGGEDPMEGAAAADVIPQSPASARVIVVGGASFAEDRTANLIQLNPLFLNGFIALHGMVDWVAQDTHLVALRAKQVMRPIDPLEANQKLLIKYGNIAGVPLALIVFGVVYWRVRETRRRRVKL